LLETNPTQESDAFLPSLAAFSMPMSFLSFTQRDQIKKQLAIESAQRSTALKISRGAAQFVEDRRSKAKVRTSVYNDTLQLLKQITNKQLSTQKKYQLRFLVMAATQFVMAGIILAVY
jgi:hypothetical protein